VKDNLPTKWQRRLVVLAQLIVLPASTVHSEASAVVNA